MNRTEIGSNNLKRLFPEAVIRRLKRYKTFHSDIFIYELNYFGHDNLPTKKVFVKYFNTTSSDELKRQFGYQSLFWEKSSSNRITTPKPLYLDIDNKMTIMEYVEGVSLKQLLTKFRPQNKKYLIDALDLSAISLASYHQLFKVSESDTILINSPLLGNNIIVDALKKGISPDKCNLKLKTISFLDFTAGNVIIDNQSTKLFLIDFPQFESLCTPHLDLARFRFGLKIIKQYPILKLHISDWWTVSSIYDHFLERYCVEMNSKLNAEDLAFIDFLEVEYARKLQNIYKNSKFRLKLTLEKYYMAPFINHMLKPNKLQPRS